jgi:RimJ/RimL family protein N-acetyltransferase
VPALPFPEPPLSDGVVSLRPWREDDAAVKAGWASDPEVLRWAGLPEDYTEAAARDLVADLEASRLAGRQIALAIVEASSDRVLGSCDVRYLDPEDLGLGETGYLLGPEARGRGAATRAMRLLVDWSFCTLGMMRIQALVHPDNPRSASVLERLGFRREGRLRAYRAGPDGREDRVLYAIFPGELTPG